MPNNICVAYQYMQLCSDLLDQLAELIDAGKPVEIVNGYHGRCLAIAPEAID